MGKYIEIETLREKLNKKVGYSKNLIVDEETLRISKELDVLMNEYYNKTNFKKNRKS